MRHFVPRIVDPSTHLSPLAWVPVERLVQPVESQPYPVPAPPVARLLDAALARVVLGEEDGGGRPGMAQAQAAAVEEAAADEGEGLALTLGDLARSTPPPPLAPAAASAAAAEQGQGQGQGQGDEDWRAARQCVGREVERLVDALVGRVLTLWGERVAAQRGAEPRYVEALARAAATGKGGGGGGGDDRRDAAVLGDWVSVLQAVELQAGERAALEAEAAAAAAAREKLSKAARRREEHNAYRRFLTRVGRAKEGKKGEQGAGEGQGQGREEREEGQQEAVDWEVLAPVLDSAVRARARARLEALLLVGR